MQPKDGIRTTEFWITAISNIIAALLAIIAARGLISQEESELWLDLGRAFIIAAVPVAMAWLNRGYIQSRTELKKQL